MTENKFIIYIQIAGFNIKINLGPSELIKTRNLMFSYIKTFYRGFLLKKNPRKIDYLITVIDQKKLDYIFNKKEQKNYVIFFRYLNEYSLQTTYYIGYYLFGILITTVLEKLLHRNQGFFFHASANLINGKVILFSGNQGAGKSTIASLLDRRYRRITDDLSIVREINGQYYLYQPHFYGKIANIEKSKRGYLIDKIYFLKQNNFTRIEPILSLKTALSLISSQVFGNTKKINIVRQKQYKKFASKHKLYFLYFKKNYYEIISTLQDKKK